MNLLYDKNSYFSITYRFSFENSKENFEFPIFINKTTIVAAPLDCCKDDNWTKLEYKQCSICTLDPASTRHCPIAYNLSGLIDRFSNVLSYEMAEIQVVVEERTYFKRESVQEGLRSILGIYMASSGCPHMELLRPMVRFHLPFASMEETVYRHVTSYLLCQYFDHIAGKQPDFDLKELKDKQAQIDQVNKNIINRLKEIKMRDANRNALIILNTLGHMVKHGLDTKLDGLKYLFKNNC